MAIIVGLTGTLSIPQFGSTYISSITLSGGPTLLETPAYGGSGGKTRVAAIKDLGGQGVAFLAAGINPFLFDGTAGALTITYKSGCSITFTASISNVQVAGAYDGLNIVTFSFANAADANPTVAWA